MTSGYELKVLDGINNSELWMIRTTLGHDLRVLDIMKISRLWLI